MKKSEFLKALKEWMDNKEEELHQEAPNPEDGEEMQEMYSEYADCVRNIYLPSYTTAQGFLAFSSSPLELAQALKQSYDSFVKDLAQAAVESGDFPKVTYISDFIDLFLEIALSGMEWEDE